MMKNKQILKGIMYNSLLLLTLMDGHSSDLNKEDFDVVRWINKTFKVPNNNDIDNDLKKPPCDSLKYLQENSRPYQFSPEYKAIARKYGHDYDTLLAPKYTTSLGQAAPEFRSKASEFSEKAKKQNEQQNKIGRAVVNTTMDVAKEEIEKKIENKALKKSISESLDIIGDPIKSFFFGNLKEK